jgi:stalled ribosome rescue protein Dom34
VGGVAPKTGYRRGYAVAMLIGLENNAAFVWRVYSQVVKPEKTVLLEGVRSNPKAVYNFHEAIVDALRSIMKEGVRSIILVSPPRTTYSKEFIDHVKRHHAWLAQGGKRVTFAEITGSAATREELTLIAKKPELHKLVQDVTSQETEDLLDLLESWLNSPNKNNAVLYSLEEAEPAIFCFHDGVTPEFIMLTNEYLAKSRHKGRVNKLLQVAANKRIKTRVVDAESPAGKRLSQLGGIVCLARKE